MGRRLELHEELCEILGSRNVYFQPPPSIEMDYPCIVYEVIRIKTEFANNDPYKHDKVYQLTYIDEDPESDIPDKLSDMRCCVFERVFEQDELYHTLFRLTY